MSILRDARKIVINDGQFTANDNRVTVSQSAANFGRIRPRSILHILHSHSAVAGLLNASEQFDAPKCDPDTRVAIIETITDWVQAGNSSSSSSMFWLHGPAGVGKSAVAQEVALLLDKERNHAASFFFSRTAVGRNNGNMLVVTLAYQIAMNFPPIRTYIAKSIKHNPAVFTLSNKVQMQKLIIEPVNKVRKSFTYRFSNLLFRRWNQPRLIVVDGLDECDDPQVQCDLLTVIGQAIQQLHMPFRFLITSRPESHILSTFQLDSLFQPGSGIDVTQRNLGEDSDANDDIRTFLHKAFKEIQRTHPLRRHLPEVWPIPTEIEQLIQKSSGNFIYPSTVIRYIQSPLLRPHDCLRVILGLSAIPSDDRPYGRLDDLYYHIFSSIPAKHKESIKLIFDILVIPRPSEGDELGEFTTPSMLEKLLSFPTGHVEHILGNLLCLVNLHGSDKPVKILHASLADFLLDSSRSGEFHADMGRAHQALARGYTRLILEAKLTSISSQLTSSLLWRICTTCQQHTIASVLYFQALNNMRHMAPWTSYISIYSLPLPTALRNL
ncbi:hypothetical protein BDZ97DRAFT_854240 [Flammula alnicola]|nr:hypothetical protein BDZ97DRAFT_854240 [Flammula alnicola]